TRYPATPSLDDHRMKRKILIDVLEEKPNKPLYHYTTQSGLLGIVGQKEIWATHTQYLNDTREGLHAVEMVHRRIKSLIAECNCAETSQILQELGSIISGLNGDVVKELGGNVCVCSFS